MISLFADKSSLLLRKMLKDPSRGWVIQDFTTARDEVFSVGQGRVQKVLNEMDRLGYVEREKRGRRSKTILTNPEKLIEEWLARYRFEQNEVNSFYSPDRHVLKKLRDYFSHHQTRYALTLHTAANMYTSFVTTDDVYFYLDARDIEESVLRMRQELDLKQLVQGGNVHVVRPYYKHSVFYGIQKKKGYVLVSNVQLYLDLHNFQPRGREHAEYLRKILQEKGKSLA